MQFSAYFLSLAVDEDKSSKKKKKKKKKSKVAPPAETANADLSMAILGGSSDRNSMEVFSYPSEDGHSVVGITESAMEEMGLFEGDTVSIKGKRGKKTLASVAVLDESDMVSSFPGASAIGMS